MTTRQLDGRLIGLSPAVAEKNPVSKGIFHQQPGQFYLRLGIIEIRNMDQLPGLGFKGLSLPTKPVFGPPNVDDLNYNLSEFEPLWDCITDVGLQ